MKIQESYNIAKLPAIVTTDSRNKTRNILFFISVIFSLFCPFKPI